MKEFILSTVCLIIGALIGRFTVEPSVVENEKIVEKEKIVTVTIEKEIHGCPVKIVAMQEIQDLRPARNAVNAAVVLDKEVPNSYGLLVVDLKTGGFVKLKITDNQGPGFRWGGPVNKLNTQWSPKILNMEPSDFAGCTARFYSSDFPPEVLKR